MPEAICAISGTCQNNTGNIENNSPDTKFSLVANSVNQCSKQGRYMRRTTIFIFSFCIGLVTKFNGSALGVLKHHYITKRIRELLIGNSRFLIYNSLNQLLYYTI